MLITFIIHGHPTTIDVGVTKTLYEALGLALITSRNLARLPWDWELRSEAGALVDIDSEIWESDDTTFYLSLRIGAGGSSHFNHRRKYYPPIRLKRPRNGHNYGSHERVRGSSGYKWLRRKRLRRITASVIAEQLEVGRAMTVRQQGSTHGWYSHS